MSVYNGEKFTAEESYIHFKKFDDNNKSDGVVAVMVQECRNENLNCEEDNWPYDGHSTIDFTKLTNGEIERKAKKLKALATNRGWLYKHNNGE